MIDSGTVQFTAPDGSLRQAPICELELELEQGEASDLFTLACELAQTLPLMPADVSKAERGYRLYLDLPLRPTHAEVSTLSADQGVVEAFRDRAYACVRHWQANVADALALAAAQPQHVEQVIGLVALAEKKGEPERVAAPPPAAPRPAPARPASPPPALRGKPRR